MQQHLKKHYRNPTVVRNELTCFYTGCIQRYPECRVTGFAVLPALEINYQIVIRSNVGQKLRFERNKINRDLQRET